MLRAPTPQSELAAVRQRLRALQKQACKSEQKQNLRQVGPPSWRCAPASFTCMVVFVYSGGSSDTAADFAQGRGWWKSAGKPPVRFSLERRQKAVSEIEVAYDTAPLSRILAIESNPVEAGLVTQLELVNIVRWLVEHSLYQWVETQNSEHGVAPPRMQLVEKALSAVPTVAPEYVRREVGRCLTANQRSQRRWLAKFRLRWGLRLGKLKACNSLSMEEKRAKAGLGRDRFW